MCEKKKIEKLFKELISAKVYLFPLPRQVVIAPIEKGVYVICDPDGNVVHVGRTPRAKNGLRQRLKNHLAGQSSFVHTFLEGKKEILRKVYSYKYLVVKDSRERALLEAYAIGMLCPAHVGVGESLSNMK